MGRGPRGGCRYLMADALGRILPLLPGRAAERVPVEVVPFAPFSWNIRIASEVLSGVIPKHA